MKHQSLESRLRRELDLAILSKDQHQMIKYANKLGFTSEDLLKEIDLLIK